MQRYFLEVSYKGTRYSGFQVQNNAVTIQSKVQEALQIFYKSPFQLTCSSRTDAGVHALQNFFHLDTDLTLINEHCYNLNALLPSDIVIKQLIAVNNDLHARFSADFREYKYYITNQKNPFCVETAWYYPYSLDIDLLNQAAIILLQHNDFQSFSKKHTQVNNYRCTLFESKWIYENSQLTYIVKGNRFLRGMVRALVGTMLLVGRKSISLDEFESIILQKNCNKANFSTPANGLFLVQVHYPSIL
ncbi:MAG: tRNA pseudouridine(38-40) synthase TruA [Chitinophagaceae bacterium]